VFLLAFDLPFFISFCCGALFGSKKVCCSFTATFVWVGTAAREIGTVLYALKAALIG
jgi:hypothetical protein